MLRNLSSLVTGGAKGIGKALAEASLKAGARVAIIDFSSDAGHETEKEFKKLYGEEQVMFVKVDVNDSKELTGSFQKVYDQFNGLDLLINCAGIPTLREEEWRRTINTNLVALIECCYLGKKFLTKVPRGSTCGHIINLASAGGLAGMPYDAVYSASKHGVVGLSKSLAERWIPEKIRVNCLCPMYVDTALVESARHVEGYAEELAKMPLMKPSDVVKVFNELIQDENSTGEVLHISKEGVKRINKRTGRI